MDRPIRHPTKRRTGTSMRRHSCGTAWVRHGMRATGLYSSKLCAITRWLGKRTSSNETALVRRSPFRRSSGALPRASRAVQSNGSSHREPPSKRVGSSSLMSGGGWRGRRRQSRTDCGLTEHRCQLAAESDGARSSTIAMWIKMPIGGDVRSWPKMLNV